MRFEKENLQESFSFMQKRAGAPVQPPFDPAQVASFAAQGLYLGTSSWRYRGWEGLLYAGGYGSEGEFQRSALAEYASLLPAVGADLTYYSWPTPEIVTHFLESTPETFRFCLKVPQRVTSRVLPCLSVYGKLAGQESPDYLSLETYLEKFHEPLRRLGGRVGCVQFEFSGGLEELPLWREFFRGLPREWTLAVEPKNAGLVAPDFYRFLLELGLSPVFVLGAEMPSLPSQWEAYAAAGGRESRVPLVVLGVLRPGRAPEQAVKLFAPYKEIKDICEEGREELAAIGREALALRREAYLFVHNQLEGSAPFTVADVARRLSLRRG